MNAAVSYAHSRGSVVLVALGGPSEAPYTGDAAAYGLQAAQWAATYGLDGVDFSLENIESGFSYGGGVSSSALIAWIVGAARAAASGLASGAAGGGACGSSKFVTHSPYVSAPVGSRRTAPASPVPCLPSLHRMPPGLVLWPTLWQPRSVGGLSGRLRGHLHGPRLFVTARAGLDERAAAGG